jgi:hypothetical protein
MATVEKPAPERDIPQGTAYGRPPQHPDAALTRSVRARRWAS